MDIAWIIGFAKDHGKELVTQVLLVLAAFGGLLKAVEALLQFIAPFTKWTWDDNLATALGKITAAKIFNKKS
jgi:hypothetical protein